MFALVSTSFPEDKDVLKVHSNYSTGRSSVDLSISFMQIETSTGENTILFPIGTE